MNKVLINFAHPAKKRSKINNALRAAVEGLENVTVNKSDDINRFHLKFVVLLERLSLLTRKNRRDDCFL